MSRPGASPRDPVADLLSTDRAAMVAPAGCGKTELIADALLRLEDGRHLVLTHTHAGVAALRARLLRKGVPAQRARVDTVASWALRVASSYPALSGLGTTMPTGAEWTATYAAAKRLFSLGFFKDVVRESYASVFVDEYQDCTAEQHVLALGLAEVLPCRILGDPLQGIFGFRGNQLVNWDSDVFPTFGRVPDLTVPWRWVRRNEPLGHWLLSIRPNLQAGEPIDVSDAPIEWRPFSDRAQTRACLDVAGRPGSVSALRKWARDCHILASKLSGRFTSMEEMDCKDMLKFCRQLDEGEGAALVETIVEVASACMTKASTALGPVLNAIERGRPVATVRQRRWRPVVAQLARLEESSALAAGADALKAMVNEAGVVVFRRELLGEFVRAVETFRRGDHASLQDAAWYSRNLTRVTGRRTEARTVSRTLLVKGLEFDHVVVANADEHDAKNLYVALTRGSNSVTLLSRAPRLLAR